METISRQSAADQKLARYFTGEPCKRGHLSERYTVNTGCVECTNPLSISSGRKSNGSLIKEERLQLAKSRLILQEEQTKLKREIAESRRLLIEEEMKIKLIHAECRKKEKEFSEEQKMRLGNTRITARTVRHAIAQMQTINIRVDEDNLLFFKGEVLKLAQSICEDLTLPDLISTGRPRAGNIHVFRCFPEHAGQLRDLQNSLEKPLPRKTDDHSMIGTYAPFNVGDPVMAMIDGRGGPAWIVAIEDDAFVLITPAEDVATVTSKEMIGHWHIKDPLPAIVAQLRNLTS